MAVFPLRIRCTPTAGGDAQKHGKNGEEERKMGRAGYLDSGALQEAGHSDRPTSVGTGVDTTSNESNVFHWLDRQAPGSVIYVAFGSETLLNTEILYELAFGLESSQMPFLWVIRKPIDVAGEGKEMLPEGFDYRTCRDRGVIAMGWIDSLHFGHPLLPFIVDQGIITRVMEERRIGIGVPRNEEDGSFSREVLAKAIDWLWRKKRGINSEAKRES